VFVELPTTQWTQIQAARGKPLLQRDLWGAIFRVYWKPLYFLARKRGLTDEAAADAIQSFAEKALSSSLLESADEQRGRMRSYLAKSFTHHLSSTFEKESAQKRGGKHRHVDIDAEGIDAELQATHTDPLLAFETAWALSTVAEARRVLRAEYPKMDRSGNIDLLESYLEGKSLAPLADLAREMKTTVPFLKSFFYRGKLRFREILLTVVKETLGPGETPEEELAHVLRSLSR
jgi:hypothetical protein